MLLSTTGIALNHVEEWGLESIYLKPGWLLRWYGEYVPKLQANYSVGDQHVTQLTEHLLLDSQEVAHDVAPLQGAVRTSNFVIMASTSEVLIVVPEGHLVERIDMSSDLPHGIDALAWQEQRVLYLSCSDVFQSDEDVLSVQRIEHESHDHELHWSQQSEVPPEHFENIAKLYRGEGISVARLLGDLHSGRLFTRMGPLFIDLIGLLLLVLSVTGIILWF